MTNAEQNALRARRLMIDAALDMTRMKGKMRWACRLILLEGKTPTEAARRVGVRKQNVYRGMLRARAKLALVETEAAKLSELRKA
jgi:DNA-directed RNA polymerase specialized sigma24 family protein